MSGNDVVTYIAQHSNLYREWEIRFEYIKIALIAFSARSYSALCMCVGEVQMGCRENLIITDTVLWELSTLYDFVSGCKRVDFFYQILGCPYRWRKVLCAHGKCQS